MKTFKFLLAGAVALMAFAGCSDDVDEPANQNQNQNQNNDYDDSYYAKNASISSSDDRFAVTDEGAVISFGASGGEVVVAVDCGTEWTAKNNAEDIFGCTIQSKSVTITAGQNLVGEELTGTITLVTAKKNIEFATITVTQAGQAYVTLSPEELSLPNIESTNTVMVESNYDWDYTYDASNGWFSVEKNEKDSSLSVICSKNETGSDREGIVTVTAGDGDKNVAEAELKITQSWENLDALILEYTITSNKEEVCLPVCDIVDVTIDWDDGDSSINLFMGHPRHTYSTPGIYHVTINGTAKSLTYWDNGYDYITKGWDSLTAVIQWGDIGLTSMEHAFAYCNKLSSLPAETGDALADVTTFKGAFYGCPLESVPSDLFTKCSKVTSFYGTFAWCRKLVTVPETLFSGCTAATNFAYTFYLCSALIDAPSFEGCSSATTFEKTFYHCDSLTSTPENMFSGCTAARNFYHTFYDITTLTNAPSFEGCSAATTFEETFYGCTSLTSIPENMFSGCTSVTTFAYTFYNCPLTSAPSFEGCSSAKTFEHTFENCTSLTTVPENMFSGCTSVTTFLSVFRNCTNMVYAPKFEGCSAVTTFASAFYGCTALTAVPENIFYGCTAVTSFGSTFYNCSSLKAVPVSLFDNLSLITSFSSTFYGCSSVSGESPYTEVDVNGEKVNVHIYERSDYAIYMRCSNPTSYSSCFKGSSFSDYSSIPSSWK